MKNKKPYTFTLNEDLVDWLRQYSKEQGRTMSSILNSYIFDLKKDNSFFPKRLDWPIENKLEGIKNV